MRTEYEFRMREKFVGTLFRAHEGERLDKSVRRIVLTQEDDRLKQVGELHRKLCNTRNEPLFFGWDIRYRYRREEIESAELLYLEITAVFEPDGEDCGTKYDYSKACKICKAGRIQRSPLILDLRKAPKKKDIARTIDSDEWIVSQRLAEIMADAKLSGYELRPVLHKSNYLVDPVDLRRVPSGQELIRKAEKRGIEYGSWTFDVWLNRRNQHKLADQAWKEYAALRTEGEHRRRYRPPIWYQLIITSRPVRTAPPTRFGIGPFDDDPKGEYRCPRGHVSGHNLLSEVYVRRDKWDGSDLAITQDKIHMRVALPASLLLISPRFWRVLRDNKIKGYMTTVAHLV